MPIRINLMAEAQSVAELRRKDPVKRGIWIGGFVLCVVVLWIAKLKLDTVFEHGSYETVDQLWKSKAAKYAAVTNNQIKTIDVNQKLSQLDRLTTNRFLWAPVLNALQKSMVDDVQVTLLQGAQTLVKEPSHIVGNGPTHLVIPGAVVEKVTLQIGAKDLNPNAQDYTKFEESLCNADFFARRLGRRDGFVLDGTLGPLTVDPVDQSRQYVTFTLATHFPEVRRNE